MTYIVTFKITTAHPIEDTEKLVTRKFPQFLCGQSMTTRMFVELMLAEYPCSTVQIYSIAQQQ